MYYIPFMSFYGRYFLNSRCGFEIQILSRISTLWMGPFNLSNLIPGLSILSWGLNAFLTWAIILERPHRFFVEVCLSWLSIYLIMDGWASNSSWLIICLTHCLLILLDFWTAHVCSCLRIYRSNFWWLLFWNIWTCIKCFYCWVYTYEWKSHIKKE